MFSGNSFMLPGQALREFIVWRKNEKRITEIGRVVNNGEYKAGAISAILAMAKGEEKERWKQLQEPVTHKIIMRRRADFEILPSDVFEYNGRRFVQSVAGYNVGDLSEWIIFYCVERIDTNAIYRTT